MSQNEIVSKIESLKEWEAILEEAQTVVEELRDCIKEQMYESGVEEMQAGTYTSKLPAHKAYIGGEDAKIIFVTGGAEQRKHYWKPSRL